MSHPSSSTANQNPDAPPTPDAGQGGALNQLSPAWADELLERYMERRGRVSIALMPTHEAATFRNMSHGTAGYSRIRIVDPLRRLVIHSRTEANIAPIDRILNLTGRYTPRGPLAQLIEPGAAGLPDIPPAVPPAVPPVVPLAGLFTRLNATEIVFLCGVAFLGGLFAEILLTYGPLRVAFAVAYPIIQLKALVESTLMIISHGFKALLQVINLIRYSFTVAMQVVRMIQKFHYGVLSFQARLHAELGLLRSHMVHRARVSLLNVLNWILSRLEELRDVQLAAVV